MVKTLVICHDGLDSVKSVRYNLQFTHRCSIYNYTSEYRDTLPSWTSIYTGLHPDQHGFRHDGWNYWFYNCHRIHSLPCMWKELDRSVGLYLLPVTSPAVPIKGWMIAGFPVTPSSDNNVYPYDILPYAKTIPDSLMAYDINGEDKPVIRSSDNNREDMYEYTKEVIDSRVGTLENILEEYPVDTLFVGYSFLDHLGHICDPKTISYKERYELVDHSIETLCSMIRPDVGVIVSDHGGDEWWVRAVQAKCYNHTPSATLATWGVEPVNVDDSIHEWGVKDVILPLLTG